MQQATAQLRALLLRNQGAAKVILLSLSVLVLAWLLTKTSASLTGNVPLALLSVLSVRWLLIQLGRQQRAVRAAPKDPPLSWRHEPVPSTPAPTFGLPAGSSKPESWRKYVRAPVVEEAWARFAGSIIQEWIYDIWYAQLTPDREFPAEVRRLLNTAFGQLSMRARRLDLRVVMSDVCELLMEQLELYRDTRDSILLATEQPHCLRDMSPAARDRAFQREMRAEKNLHPALQTPDGHYKFLKAVSEGAVAYLLDKADLQRTPARVVCRELLASCVFRPLMMWATPYYANKALYSLLREQQKRPPPGSSSSRDVAAEAAEAAEVSAALASARSEAQLGHWMFEQRLLNSVAAEDTALSAARQLRHHLRSKLSHARSKSVDMLPGSRGQPGDEQQASARQQHPRSRSCAPASSAATEPLEVAAAAAADAAASSSSSLGAPSGSHSARPPRPPPLQLERLQSPFELGASSMAAGAAQTHQQQEQEEAETPKLGAGSGWRAASQQQQQQPARQQAESLEASAAGEVEGDGWESVEASEASLTLARRDFSVGHLLAPMADQRAVANVTPRAASSSSNDGSSIGTSAYSRAGFSGRARAKVVAADLNTSGSKDYVEFKIRVADDAEEWTVSRRYRNFEVLHRQLRIYSSYKLKLPPKRIFVHSNSVEFVEERREALDRYLTALLEHKELAHCSDLFEFLRAGSQLYELPSPHPPTKSGPSDGDLRRRKMLGGLSKGVMEGAHNMGRGLSCASNAVAGSVKQSMSGVASAAAEGMSKVTSGVAGAAGAVVGALAPPSSSDMRSGGLTRRVQSVPSGLDGSDSKRDAADRGLQAQRGNSGSSLQREKSGGLLSRAGLRLRGAISRDSSAQQQQQLQPESSAPSSSSSAVSEQLGDQVQGPAIFVPPAQSVPLSGSPTRASKLFSSLRRSKSRSNSPLKQRERSPNRKQRRGTSSTSTSRRNSAELGVPPLDLNGLLGAGEGLPPHFVSSLHGSPPASPASPALASFPVEPSLDLDDSAGISAPLYEMVDCLFQLQTRGFFRRQVFAVARQTLSLVAGEAIDNYLTQQLRLLRQQHTIGRIIQRIQASLWPGGIWFANTPAAQAQAAAAATAAAAAQQQQQQQQGQAGSQPAVGAAPPASYVRPEGMQPEKFLQPGTPLPLDGDEIREAVEQLMLRRAPSALVRLIGKNAYASGMQDLFDMVQSPTFMHHIGYGVLEIAVVHLFPELKSLFRTLQHGGLG